MSPPSSLMDDALVIDEVVDEIVVDCVGKAIQLLLHPPSVCKWTDCDWPGADDDLVDHIREIHVELQPYGQTSAPQERFVCLWEGCKVYGKVSLSRSWLERHALAHSGPRPFKCIVDRCGARFKVRSALERHVNGHFACDFDESSLESETSNGKQRLSPARPRRRKSMRGRGRCVNLKSDFFDLGVMERLRFDLFQMSAHLGLERQVTFHGRVIARRREDKTGECHALLRYQPEDILPDTWVRESSLEKHATRTISLARLPHEAVGRLMYGERK